jgi:hypothetical protein
MFTILRPVHAYDRPLCACEENDWHVSTPRTVLSIWCMVVDPICQLINIISVSVVTKRMVAVLVPDVADKSCSAPAVGQEQPKTRANWVVRKVGAISRSQLLVRSNPATNLVLVGRQEAVRAKQRINCFFRRSYLCKARRVTCNVSLLIWQIRHPFPLLMKSPGIGEFRQVTERPWLPGIGIKQFLLTFCQVRSVGNNCGFA